METTVYCPICSMVFKEFEPKGKIGINKQRLNARCGNCHTLERHRHIWIYLTQFTNILTSEIKLLHFAPPKVFYKKFSSRKNISYYPVDLFPENFRDEVEKQDITKLSYPDNTFDVLLCNHVLEHVPDDIKAMKEVYRVLSKSGFAIISVPISRNRLKTYEDDTVTTPEERLEKFGQQDHVRRYGADFTERLESVGFNTQIINYSELLSDKGIHHYGLNLFDRIYLCKKEYPVY